MNAGGRVGEKVGMSSEGRGGERVGRIKEFEEERRECSVEGYTR